MKGDERDQCKCVNITGELCKKEECRFWIDYPEDNNCVLEAVRKHGRMTLEEVGKRIGLSIVRISQIEKQAIIKLSKRIKI